MIESGEPDEIEITWSEPFANDIMSPPVTFTQTHFPGQLFPIGDTNVIYRFSDRFGNEAICSFVVSVTGSKYYSHSCKFYSSLLLYMFLSSCKKFIKQL